MKHFSLILVLALIVPVFKEPARADDRPKSSLSKDEIDWLRQHAIALRGVDPKGGFDDLHGLRDMVGEARIVAVREATHGSSEAFLVKHRITAFLAREKGFSIFALETGMAEAYRLNEYIQTGQGDPRQLLTLLGYWDWNIQEYLDLVGWMREWNRSGNGRVEFWGFDMQTPDAALENIRSFVDSVDPQYSDQLRQHFRLFFGAGKPAWLILKKASSAEVRSLAAASGRVLKHLQEGCDKYTQKKSAFDVDWAIQNARLLEQNLISCTKPFDTSYRDQCMADNVAWICERARPNAKVVISAHNAHLTRKARGTMGAHLDKRYGRSMFVLASTFYQGRYNAVGLWGSSDPTAHEAALAPPGSLEARVHEVGVPAMLLDLRQARQSPAAWFTQRLPMRDVGYKVQLIEFTPVVVTDEYDGLIFFERSSPSKLLR
jgi:erythromycin esterase